MLNIKKILLPVDFPNTSLGVVHQAAALARHFHSEVVILHVVTARNHAAHLPEDLPSPADWDLLAEIIRGARKEIDESLAAELDGLAIRRVLARGNVARAIVQMAQEENVDLIMMPSHGHTFCQFLLGSAAANVLHGTGCPVWTSSYVNESPEQNFAVRNILCAVDFNARDQDAVSWAAQLAAENGACLTLAHVTAGMRRWGPGASYTDSRWKETLATNASQRIANLRHEMGIKADIFIGCGDKPTVLGQAAKQTKADLLVTGCHPYAGHMRTHGYATICALPIPILSV